MSGFDAASGGGESSRLFSRSITLAVAFLAIAAGLLLRVVYAVAGHVYLDSGFYLEATRQVLSGKLPYRDFFFVQGPVYPYLYGLVRIVLLPILHSAILTARVTSILFGVGACILAILAARRLAGGRAAWVAFLLLIPNSFLAYDYAVAKLYAPTAFFAALGAWFLAGRGRGKPTLAAASFAVATALRLTLLPSVVVLLPLAVPWRKKLVPLLVFSGLLVGFFLPFLVLSPGALYYHTFGIHESAGSSSPYHFGLLNKVKVLLALIRDNQLFAILVVFSLVTMLPRPPRPKTAALWLCSAAVIAANFTANWVHASYQTVILPVLAVAVAATVAPWFDQVLAPSLRRPVVAALVMGAFLQPLAYGRKEIWSRDGRYASPYAPGLIVAIQSQAKAGEPVLVPNPAYAVEAERPVLRGSEGFPFTYTPSWGDERCRLAPSLNDALLIEAFREKRPAVVALVKSQFDVGFPGFVPLPADHAAPLFAALQENYKLLRRFKNPDATPNDILFYVRR